jgi:uncharacterized membrane protein YbaN (DUF454 family)
MAALVFKVGALAMKTLAKPLGDRFKNWVMTHPQYRQTVLSAAQVGMAHGYKQVPLLLLVCLGSATLSMVAVSWQRKLISLHQTTKHYHQL